MSIVQMLVIALLILMIACKYKRLLIMVIAGAVVLTLSIALTLQTYHDTDKATVRPFSRILK